MVKFAGFYNTLVREHIARRWRHWYNLSPMEEERPTSKWLRFTVCDMTICHAAWEIREEKKNSSPVLFTAQRKLFHPDSVDFLQICNALGIYVELWSSFDSLRFRRSRLPLNPIWELVKWTFDTPAKEISNWRIGIYFSINICRFLHRNALVLRDFVLFILWHFQSHIRLTWITETIPRWRM